MASWFRLELDTTPPEVELGQGRITGHAALIVPYTVTEPGIQSAAIDGVPMEIGAGALRLNGGPRRGTIVMRLADDVGNRAVVSRTFTTGLPGRIASAVLGTIAAAVDGVIGTAKRGQIGHSKGGDIA